MKKAITLFCVMGLLFSLTACSGGNVNTPNESNDTPTTQSESIPTPREVASASDINRKETKMRDGEKFTYPLDYAAYNLTADEGRDSALEGSFIWIHGNATKMMYEDIFYYKVNTNEGDWAIMSLGSSDDIIEEMLPSEDNFDAYFYASYVGKSLVFDVPAAYIYGIEIDGKFYSALSGVKSGGITEITKENVNYSVEVSGVWTKSDESTGYCNYTSTRGGLITVTFDEYPAGISYPPTTNEIIDITNTVVSNVTTEQNEFVCDLSYVAKIDNYDTRQFLFKYTDDNSSVSDGILTVAFVEEGIICLMEVWVIGTELHTDKMIEYVANDILSIRKSIISSPTPPTTAKDELTFGDVFKFDDVEIAFDSAVEWVTVTNQFSDYNGADVIKVPMTVKNISDKTSGLNMFYYDIYGSNGTRLESIRSYFKDDVSQAGDMRPGATQNTFMHILYDGDGDYYVEFDNFSTKIEVKLPFQK